jgi:putative transposase
MITATTYLKRPLLGAPVDKELTRQTLSDLVREYEYKLVAWVILSNHYHILIKSRKGTDLPNFIRKLHGKIAHHLNQQAGATGRQVWHNYWDSWIRTEASYWKRFNYIHHNPVKHGYVQHMEDWPFSSYRYYLEKYGADWLADAFRRYPIADYTEYRDIF